MMQSTTTTHPTHCLDCGDALTPLGLRCGATACLRCSWAVEVVDRTPSPLGAAILAALGRPPLWGRLDVGRYVLSLHELLIIVDDYTGAADGRLRLADEVDRLIADGLVERVGDLTGLVAAYTLTASGVIAAEVRP